MSSSYLDHLPAVFRSDPFTGQFLLAFEAVLSGGVEGVDQPGLEELAAGVGTYFDPMRTPEEFLPWLASWVGLSVRADWDAATTRGFIREIVPLYQQRGTLGGLRRMLQIFLAPTSVEAAGNDVVIMDGFEEPQHFFQVRLTLGEPDPVKLRAIQEMAVAIIEQEKPAHTFFALKVVIPTMRLVSLDLRAAEGGQTPLLILGSNTSLGTAG